MLRKIRLTFAVICFTFLTLLFLDFTGTLHGWLGWLAKIQFLPAALALNLGVVLLLVLLTFVFGRVYCSVICPLGVFQDAIAWVGKKRKIFPYQYSSAKSWLRYSMLGVLIVSLIAGVGSLVALFEPYGAYGRIASSLFQPLWQWGNNLLAYWAERAGSYTFYEVDVWLKSIPTLIVAIVTLVAVTILAWQNGRTYCNTICPVGTILGLLSRYSLFRLTIDLDKCNRCGLCARHCKSACINPQKHEIDYSRCIVCMDCIGKCKQGAIGYRLYNNKKKSELKEDALAEMADKREESPERVSETTRRSFLSLATLVTATSLLKAQRKKVDGGLATIENKKIPNRTTPLIPPGGKGALHMARHCVGCQLCVSVCPNQVLRPSTELTKLMQPEMSYERGYCRPECTKCSEVCPAGAFHPITKADKSSIQIGHAVWVKENCVPLTDKRKCGNCARHCPTGAILMIPSDAEKPNSLKIPVVNVECCIGCGACENLCPARPFSAIYVEGHERHRII